MVCSGRPSARIPRQAQPHELPTLVGVEEFAVGCADAVSGGGAGAAPQDHLVAHELTVVFAERPWRWPVAWVGEIGGAGPLPEVAEHLP